MALHLAIVETPLQQETEARKQLVTVDESGVSRQPFVSCKNK